MSIKTVLNRLLKRKHTKRIVFSFIDNPKDGTIRSFVKFDKDVPVGYAATALDRLKAEIAVGMAKKVSDAGLKPQHPGRRKFIREQTLGDILK